MNIKMMMDVMKTSLRVEEGGVGSVGGEGGGNTRMVKT